MSGLRERKKTDRNIRIQNAAIKLFGTIGYAATTMNRIADEADLGVGTLYNYYKSKDELLLSIIDDGSEKFLGDFEVAIKNRTCDILTAIDSLIDIYFKSFSIYNKLIWREFMAAALAKQPSIIEYIWKIDSLFTDKLSELLVLLRSDGFINERIDIKDAVMTLYSLITSHILTYIANDEITLEKLRVSLRKQVAVIITGLKN